MAALILLSTLSLYLARPPSALPATTETQRFSAGRALAHLQVVAEKPHALGTKQNQKIRDYIVAECEKLGLKVEVQKAHTTRSYGSLVRSAYVENVIATQAGSVPGKDLLIMSHYDTQPHTPGAGDDGAAVAAMLETMSILQQGQQLKNNVVFLFTDGEELGLNGAKAFVEQHPLAKNVGVLLNFEGRGNSGPSMTFEVNQDNGWVMEEYAKAALYPIASSLSYEIYKMLPNDTDFTVFRKQGTTGLNFAYIDGFVNYHSATDTYDNFNLNSLQHHGSYMLSLARHFGDMDLQQDTKGPDLTFFNPAGSWLLTYPASWDKILMIVLVVLFLIWIYLGLSFKRIKLTQLLLGLLIFLLTAVVIGGFTWVGQIATKALYLHYTNFYASNFYNAKYYLMTGLSFGTFIFFIIYRWRIKKNRTMSLLASVVLIQIICMIFMYQSVPTAVYVIGYPLFFIVFAQMVIVILGYKQNRWTKQYIGVLAIGYLPAIFLWVPLIYNLFLGFSIQTLVAPVLLLVFLLGMGLPIFEFVVKSRIVVNGFLLFGFVFILLGHFTSSTSAERPLQSDLVYGLDVDNNQAYWISNNLQADEWNEQFLSEASLKPFTAFYPMAKRPRLIAPTPLVDIGPLKPWMTVKNDTLINGQRHLIFIVGAEDPAYAFELILGDTRKINYLKVNQAEISPSDFHQRGSYLRLEHYGKPSEGLEFTLRAEGNAVLKPTIIAKRLGLPGIIKLPDSVIPDTGFDSHTTQVKQNFDL